MLSGQPSRAGLYAVLFLGTFLAGISISNFVPMLPIIAQSMAVPADQVQLSFPAFLFSFAFAQLFYGTISDRFGRRLPYLLGLSFYFIGSLIGYFSNTVGGFIMGRFIQGAGIGCTTVLAITILHDLHEKSLVKHFAYIMITAVIGFLVAPLITLYTHMTWAWKLAYFELAVYAGILIMLALRFLPETHVCSDKEKIHRTFFLKNYLTLIKNREFMGYLLTSCFLFALPLIIFCTMPILLATAFQLSMNSYTWLSILNVGFYLFGIYIGYLFTQGININLIITLGIFIAIVAAAFGLLLGTLDIVTLEAIYFPSCFVLFGSGIAIPCALGAYSNKLYTYPGTGTSIQLFCLIFLASLINFLNALLHENDQIPLMSVFLIISLATLFIFWLVVPASENMD